ncbi:MAG: carboxypeptidase regulatory-like domain-containing protein, partial [Candidatus Solibacter sp.]
MTAAMAAAAVANAQGSISGQVVNSVTGAPVRRAQVNIIMDGRTDLRGTAPTDGEGRFVCRSLPAGRYRLGAEKNGYAPMEYGAVRTYMGVQVIVLAAGEQKAGINIQLPQLAVMTGTVRDVDGEPAARVSVQALRHEFQRGKAMWTQAGWAITDSEGRYRMFHMMPGKYLLAAKKDDQPPPQPTTSDQDSGAGRLVYATTYFPGTLDRQQAKTIVPGPGETMNNLEFTLIQSRPIVLDVQSDLPAPVQEAPAADGNPPEGASQPLQQPSFVQLTLVEKNSSAPGTTQYGGGFPVGSRFVFNDILPGRYMLSGEVTLDGRLFAAREDLDLSGGSLNVTMHFAPAIDLTGHVRFEDGSASAASARVFRVAGDFTNRQGAEAHVQADGSYVLKSVPPGLWDIGFEPIPKGGYLKSMMLGDVDVLRADMNVTTETKAALEIVVSGAGAHLDGKVEGGQARALVVAPEGDLVGLTAFYVVTTVDEQGRFELKAMAPGQYRLYAFEDL